MKQNILVNVDSLQVFSNFCEFSVFFTNFSVEMYALSKKIAS